MLENGWRIDGNQQMLVHTSAGAAIPLELQHKSMVVHGSIRVLSEQCAPAENFHVRAIQADVNADVVNGSVGWQLDERGCGIGRHFSDHYQDPLLVKLDISGRFFRTTLVEVMTKVSMSWSFVSNCNGWYSWMLTREAPTPSPKFISI